MSSSGSRSSGSLSLRTDGSSHSVSVCARDRCAAMKMMPSAAVRPAAAKSTGSPAGGRGDARAFRFRLVEQRERAAAGPADQHDPLVAALARIADPGAHVDRHVLHDQPAVVLRIAAGGAEHVQPALRQRRRHRQQLQRGRRMHEQIERAATRGPPGSGTGLPETPSPSSRRSRTSRHSATDWRRTRSRARDANARRSCPSPPSYSAAGA